MQRLTGIDSMFVSLESPTNLFQVGAVTVLDPSTAPPGSPPPHEALRRVLEHRLEQLAPFRHRLVTTPGGVDNPRWVECAPDLDLHVRRAALPGPGAERELAMFAADVLSRPLERDRPLWEIHVVEGLEGGLVAGVAKIHHSAIDGVAGAEATAALMDLEPAPVPDGPPASSIPVERAPSGWSLLGGAALAGARRDGATARLALRVATAGLVLRGRNRQLADGPPPGFFSAPRTPLNAKVGRRRAAAFARVDRADVDMVRAATGTSVNDVILYVAGTAVRRYLEERGELPDESLVAFVPKSVRNEAHTLDTGVNRLSGMLVSLATDHPDPVTRLLSLASSAATAKDQERVLGEDLMAELAELGWPLAMSLVGRAVRGLGVLERRPPFSVVVSSFAGPSFPLYCAGAEMLAYHPFGPVIDGAALNITAMSYRDHIGFGLLACRDAVPDVDALGHYVSEAMTELAKTLSA